MQQIELVDETTACRIIGGEATPIHRATLWRGIQRGWYPKPIKVGPATNRWNRAELLGFLNKAAAERDAKAA